MARVRGWSPIVVIVLALVVANVASNRLLPSELYVPWAVAVTVAITWFARRVDGRTWGDLGLARDRFRSGLRWGGAVAGGMLVIYLVGLALPATRDLFRDDRVTGLSSADVLYAAFVRVPLGTVLLEEMAFRSVLPAMLLVRTRAWVAVAASALLFGLWHVLPAMGIETVNPVATDTVGELPGWVTVAGAVLSTSAVGVWFLFLRHKSRSVLAPMIAHWSSNGLGYLFAHLVVSS